MDYIKSIPVGEIYTKSEEDTTRQVLRTADNIIRNYFIYVHIAFYKKGGKNSEGEELSADLWCYTLIGRELSKDSESKKPKYIW